MPEIKPVMRYPDPSYPDAYRALQDPYLLRRLPERFAAKPAVRAALGVVLSLGLAGCGQPVQTAPPSAPESTPLATPTPSPAPAALSVPLFEHGGGRGSYGCVSVAPPVFLSEEEALSVIREEAAQYGLDLSGSNTIAGAALPLHRTYLMLEEQGEPLKTAEGELELDGYSEEHRIGFEFVSRQDLAGWQDPKQNVASSVEEYYFKDAAKAIAEGNQNVAAFYDPMSADYSEFEYWSGDYAGDETFDEYAARYDAAQREKSLEDLRAQVRDFLEWLKGQGVI